MNKMRAKILFTAIKILREGGIKKLSQPEICAALGIRQSQLTYYFPRRHDLVEAIVDEFSAKSRERLDQMDEKAPLLDTLREIQQQMTRPGPVRAFLGLLVEADQDPLIAKIIKKHMADFEEGLGKHLQKKLSKAQTLFLLDYLRGLGVSHFLKRKSDPETHLKTLLKALSAIG